MCFLNLKGFFFKSKAEFFYILLMLIDLGGEGGAVSLKAMQGSL